MAKYWVPRPGLYSDAMRIALAIEGGTPESVDEHRSRLLRRMEALVEQELECASAEQLCDEIYDIVTDQNLLWEIQANPTPEFIIEMLQQTDGFCFPTIDPRALGPGSNAPEDQESAEEAVFIEVLNLFHWTNSESWFADEEIARREEDRRQQEIDRQIIAGIEEGVAVTDEQFDAIFNEVLRERREQQGYVDALSESEYREYIEKRRQEEIARYGEDGVARMNKIGEELAKIFGKADDGRVGSRVDSGFGSDEVD